MGEEHRTCDIGTPYDGTRSKMIWEMWNAWNIKNEKICV